MINNDNSNPRRSPRLALQRPRMSREQRRLASKRNRVPLKQWRANRPKRGSCDNNPNGKVKFIRQGKSWWVKAPGYCRSV